VIGQEKECLVIYPPPEKCLDHNPNSIRGRSLGVAAAQANGSNSDHAPILDRDRSLQQEVVFTVKAGDPIQDNFAFSSTQDNCFCTCGVFEADVATSIEAGECFDSFFSSPIQNIGGNSNNGFFLNGWDGTGGSNFLTSTSTLPLCPSTVTFDFELAFEDFGLTVPRILTLEVIDVDEKVILTVQVPSATIEATTTTGAGFASIDLQGPNFQSCADNLRLRFNWNIPEVFTGPAQFVLDNVSVTPVRKLESKQKIQARNQLLLQSICISSTQLNTHICTYWHLPVS
jgi:hypothetical protein